MLPSTVNESYSVRVAGDAMGFAAAHFITLDNGETEPLHGHDYRVAAEMTAPLGPHRYTVDFVAVEKALRGLVRELDHRTLLPERHPAMQIDVRESEVEVRLAARRWILPRRDCVLLPIENTTAEALARHLAAELWSKLAEHVVRPPIALRVEVFESPGFSAACTLAPATEPR